MAIADKLTKLQSDISDAYDTIETKGGTVPTDKNTDSLANAIDSIPAGGGSTGDFYVRFYDCDGTLLKEEWVDLGEDATPPENPDYDPDYLTFRGWNHSYTNIQGDTSIGALYTVNDHAIYYFFRVPAGTTITFQYKNPTQEGTVDWGDGTTETLAIASSLTNISHSYTNQGEYIIKIDGVINYDDNMFNAGSSKWLVKEYVGNQHIQNSGSTPYWTTTAGQGASILVLDSNIASFARIRSNKLKVAIINDFESTFTYANSGTGNDDLTILIPNNTFDNLGQTNNYANAIGGANIENLYQITKMNGGYGISGAKGAINLKNLTTFNSNTAGAVISGYYIKEVYFEKLTSIGNRDFIMSYSTTLENIIFNESSKVSLSGTRAPASIASLNGNVNIYVRDSLVNSYKTDTYWSAISYMIKPMSELPTTSHFYRYVKNQINNE